MSDPAIEVRDLHKTYRGTVALAGLDLNIPAGAVTGLLGPNGAGKTTTIRSLLGLTRPDSGSIRVLGLEVPGALGELAKRVGAIVEEPGLIKPLNGRINLEVAADTLGAGHDRIPELLEFVGLTADAGRRVDGYSKGMRQRLALAAALLGDPELLLLDEPLDGLDPAGQHALRARLRQWADEGRTVVVSSHVLADIEALADNVAVIDRGRLVAEGPLQQILGAGDGIVVVVDKPGTALEVLSGAGLSARREAGGLLVEAESGAEVVRALAAAGVYPDEVRPARKSLESVFLGMTGGS